MLRDIRAGNIYVNRKITGARVGVEPFGGFQLSGTGPKTGSPDYLTAFMSRTAGYAPDLTSISHTEIDYPRFDDRVQPWLATTTQRRDSLQRSINLLKTEFYRDLLRAMSDCYELSSPESETLARQLIEVASNIVDSANELIEAEPTISLPGQKNYLNWETPRGKGFVVTDDSTPMSLFVGMVFGPLLAGNGLILAPSAKSRTVSKVLLKCLHRAGIPRTVLDEAPLGGVEIAEALASQMFNFAVTSMSLEQTRQIYRRLGETREVEGQHWVKALISMPDGPQPGEPGFVRLFALPKTISIRTLRHGADLELPQVKG